MKISPPKKENIYFIFNYIKMIFTDIKLIFYNIN